jgi:hypothetical protein
MEMSGSDTRLANRRPSSASPRRAARGRGTTGWKNRFDWVPWQLSVVPEPTRIFGTGGRGHGQGQRIKALKNEARRLKDEVRALQTACDDEVQLLLDDHAHFLGQLKSRYWARVRDRARKGGGR